MNALQIGPRRTIGMAALGAAMVLTAPAPAQFGLAGGIGEAFRPAFTTRDVQLAVDMLQMDDAQKFIVETLYEDYDSEFRMGVDNFRDHVSGLRDEIDPGNPDPAKIMRVVFGTISSWQVESRELAEQFTMDLKGLLNEEQLETWPGFQRKLFRLKYLRNGQLPGENLDLINDVMDLDLAEQDLEEVKPILEEYEIALHEALRKREDYLQKSQNELINAITDEDYSVGLEVARRQVELRKMVRNVNEQYTLTLSAAVPNEAGIEFVQRIQQRTYPRVFRKTPAERILAAAVEIEELDEDTQEAIAELNLQYGAELTYFNQQLVQLIRDYKPQEIQHKVEQASARLSGASPNALVDPTRDRFVKRREIGTKYVEQLKILLTPEQFAALPGARRWLQQDAVLTEVPTSEALRKKRARYKRSGPAGVGAPGAVDIPTGTGTGSKGLPEKRSADD